MVDSRDKGKRAEYQVRDMLRDQTGLGWERVPGSGGLSSVQGLKGDVHIPQTPSQIYCIEVKHYKEDTINYLLLKNPDNQFAQFWAQTVRESKQVGKEPLLIFKKDRGQWSVATRKQCDTLPELTYVNEFRENKNEEAHIDQVFIYLFAPWLATKSKGDFI